MLYIFHVIFEGQMSFITGWLNIDGKYKNLNSSQICNQSWLLNQSQYQINTRHLLSSNLLKKYRVSKTRGYDKKFHIAYIFACKSGVDKQLDIWYGL